MKSSANRLPGCPVAEGGEGGHAGSVAVFGSFRRKALCLHDGRDDGSHVDFASMRCLVAPHPSGRFFVG
jgi:hypothetical protein